MSNKTIAIIGAMECEVELLHDLLKNSEKVQDNKFEIFKGEVGEHTVIIAKSGVGKVASACCTQFIADKFHPEYIINTGVAGGIGENLSVGDIVVAKKLVQHDFDATVLGYAKGYMCTGHDKDKPTAFYSDEQLVDEFVQIAKNVAGEDKVHTGTIASGDMFVGTSEKKKEIKDLFGATAAEMEGCAIAQAADINNIPFVIVRAVSDLADGTAAESLSDFEQKSAHISANIIKRMLEDL